MLYLLCNTSFGDVSASTAMLSDLPEEVSFSMFGECRIRNVSLKTNTLYFQYKWFSTSNKSTCPICRNLF